MINYRIGSKSKETYPASRSNRITESYYYFLVGEINRGYNFQSKAVARIEQNGHTTYYDISVY